MKTLIKEQVIEQLKTSKIFTKVSLEFIDFDTIDFSSAVFDKCHFKSIVFRKCNLKSIDFNHCTFETVRFNWCDLSNNSIFNRCKLEDSEFYSSNLGGIRFQQSQLEKTSFSYSSLNGSWFSNGSLTNCKITSGDIRRSLFVDIDFKGFTFNNVALIDLEFIKPKNLNPLYVAKLQMCPEYGEFYGFKKVVKSDYEEGIALVKIPAHAKRSSAGSRKCRASEVEVVKIWDEEGNEIDQACSIYDINFVYKVGEIVKPKYDFDENWWEECASGIHFFMTKAEAEDYN